MADKEQLDFLLKCSKNNEIEKWNKWRIENPEVKIDLTWGDLRSVNLPSVNFGGADLSGVDLRETNLRKANFFEANLIGANLIGADLNNAVLEYAYLQVTAFNGANLQGARFSHANLFRADLSSANLTGASLFNMAREQWDIKGVKCDFIYTDEFYHIKLPADRYFEEGEFEKRFKSLPSFEIPCRSQSDLEFATKVAGFYNFKIESNSGLSLKSIDIQTEIATYTVLRKDDLEKVQKIINEFYCLKDKHGKLEYLFNYIERKYDRLENKVIGKMGNTYGGDHVEGNKTNIGDGASNFQVGNGNVMTINNHYYQPEPGQIEKVEAEINNVPDSEVPQNIKTKLLDQLKECLVEEGKGMLKEKLADLSKVATGFLGTVGLQKLPEFVAFLSDAGVLELMN